MYLLLFLPMLLVRKESGHFCEDGGYCPLAPFSANRTGRTVVGMGTLDGEHPFRLEPSYVLKYLCGAAA